MEKVLIGSLLNAFIKDHPSRSHSVAWHFAVWFIPLAAAILTPTAMIGQLQIHNRIQAIKSQEFLHTRLAAEPWGEAFARWVGHLRSIALQEDNVRLGLNRPDGRPLLEEAFRTLLHRNPEYEQMRWIGEDGREQARIDRNNNGALRTVPANELQDKRDRPYFSETLKLPVGSIYVSPIDLNIEHGQIERPFRPMLRLGIRIAHADGSGNGMLILNINPTRLFDNMARQSQGNHTNILDDKGYWLHSPRPDEEWGFMFQKTETFGTRHPKIWASISTQESGQLETPEGLWTWTTLDSISARQKGITPHQWKLVEFEPDIHDHEDLWIWGELAAASLLVLGLFAIGIGSHARETVRRMRLQEDMENRNLELSASIRQHMMTLDQLEQTLTELYASNRIRDEFLSTMSHELRTPLNGIIGMTDLALTFSSNPEQANFLEMAKTSALDMTRLIERILTYIQLDSGKMTSSPQLMNLREIVQQSMQAHSVQAGRQSISIKMDVRPEVPEGIHADGLLLRCTLAELLANAIAFNPAGLVDINVAMEPGTPEQIHFSVRDTGAGMDTEAQAGLFKPFRQADGSLSRTHGGIGLGLAMAHKYVTLMGGRIWAESTPGKGSTFHFTVPLVEGDSG